MDTTRQLARFIVETQPAQIPEAVLHESKRCLINILGVALHATQDPAMKIVLDLALEEGGLRKASVLGTRVSTSLQNAAMVNGFLAHLDDYDDTLFPTVFHPSAPTIPAALAVAEYAHANGREFLIASTIGLEAACRIALAFQGIHHGAIWHMSGVIGGFGAAAAVGRLLKLDVNRMTRGLGLAGTQASGMRETFGTMTKAFHIARANQSGIVAALLAQRDFTCTDTVLEGKLGFGAAFTPDDFNLGRITDRLLEHWELPANSPKPYACGILSHCMIDAMLAFRAMEDVTPEQVASICGKVNPAAIKLESRPEPATGLVGRLSFQHAMAVALVDGMAYPQQFTDERVNNSVVAHVRSLIDVKADASIGPNQCDLTMTLTDGRTLAKRIEHATGTPGNPMTDAQLETKFKALAGCALPKTRVDRLLKSLWRLEEIDDMQQITTMCRMPIRKAAST